LVYARREGTAEIGFIRFRTGSAAWPRRAGDEAGGETVGKKNKKNKKNQKKKEREALEAQAVVRVADTELHGLAEILLAGHRLIDEALMRYVSNPANLEVFRRAAAAALETLDAEARETLGCPQGWTHEGGRCEPGSLQPTGAEGSSVEPHGRGTTLDA